MAVQVEATFTNGVLIPGNKEPFFLGDAGVDGYISLVDQRDVNVEVVKISLEGFLLNSIRYIEWIADAPVHIQTVQKLVRLTEVKGTADFVESLEQRQRRRKSFFHFEIPNCLESELLGKNSGLLGDLPASFPQVECRRTSAVLQERCMGDCHIAYCLHVQVFFGGKMLTSSKHPIKIVPTLDCRPPICVADFSTEYTLAKSRHLREGLLGIHRNTEWRLETIEPICLILGHITDHFVLSTTLKLTQKTSSHGNHLSAVPMDVTECRCTGSLISSTFISSVPRQTVPTLREISTRARLSRNFNTCGKGNAPVKFSRWSKVMQSRSDANNVPDDWPRWETEAALTIPFQNLQYLVPTFSSSLVSQRYKLTLDVQIVKPRRIFFRLSLPVQIAYRTVEDRRFVEVRNVEPPPYFD